MKKQIDYTLPAGLLFLLFALSFFKDDFTPDYLNTPAAAFLSPQAGISRLSLIPAHFSFWILAFLYSLSFAALSYWIIKGIGHQSFAGYVFVVFAAIFLVEYILILMNVKLLDTAIIPKINRFYHSPIPCLFLIAALTINNRIKA